MPAASTFQRLFMISYLDDEILVSTQLVIIYHIILQHRIFPLNYYSNVLIAEVDENCT
jgi:hypothetical protein